MSTHEWHIGTAMHEWTIVSDTIRQAMSKTTSAKSTIFDSCHLDTPQGHRHQKWRKPRPGQSSTIVQIFTPIGAKYLSLGKNTYLSSQENSMGAAVNRPILYIIRKLWLG